MGLEPRPVTADELPEFIRVTFATFGTQASDALLAAFQDDLEVDRTLAVFDGSKMVATAATYTMRLTVPGNATVPVGGLTFVGVLPTHRRRGLLRRLMDRQLRDVAERGEVASVLTASESIIYGRFGYGLATRQLRFELETRHAALALPFTDPGRIELVDREAALELFPPVHDRYRARTPGEVSRSPARWRAEFAEMDEEVSGSQGWFHVVHRDEAGEPDGFAWYRFSDTSWESGIPRGRLTVQEVVATDDAARTALWRYLANVDLVESLTHARGAPDEPFWWQLADPRRLRATSVTDHLWVRLLDLPTILAARTYGASDRLVLDVSDEFRPDLAGRYALEATTDGAACVRTDADADLSTDVATLGAAYLGGVAVTTLHRAGRVIEHTRGAVRRADALLQTPTAPFCGTAF